MAASLTFDAMLQAPRPGVAAASSDGTRWLQSVSQHSFATERTTRSIVVGEIGGSARTVLTNLRFGDALWAGDTILYVRPVDAEADSKDVDADKPDTEQPTLAKGVSIWAWDEGETYCVGRLPDVEAIGDYMVSGDAFAFAADVYASHPLPTAFDEGKKAFDAHKRGAAVKTYDSLPVRQWNHWADGHKRHLFVVEMNRDNGKLHFDADHVKSPMAKSARLSVGDQMHNGGYHAALSSTHIAFNSYAPETQPTYSTELPIWLIDWRSGEPARQVSSPGVGCCLSPSFSADGKRLVFSERVTPGHDTDLARVVLYDLATDTRRVLSSPDWDYSAEAVCFSADEKSILTTTPHHGSIKVFRLEIADGDTTTPRALTTKNSVSSVEPLAGSDDLLVTIHSFCFPNTPFLLKPDGSLSRLHDPAPEITELGLKPPHSLHYKAANPHQDVQTWLFEPPDFQPGSNKRWPFVFLLHGGPTAAVNDIWSTRWNAQVWASAGAFVSWTNHSGSDGFGKRFMDDVQRQWGGYAYDDCRISYQRILQDRPEIDPERTVAMGGSFGGYAAFQIQSRPYGFKALVAHASTIDLAGDWLKSDDSSFIESQMGGAPWQAREAYEKWNAFENAGEWSTPMLLTHGMHDARCDVTEALSGFNVLQKNGVPSRLVVYETEDHFVLGNANARHWQSELHNWVERWVGWGAK